MTIEVVNLTPSAGEITRDTPLQFDVRTSDGTTFVCVFVAIEFPGSDVVELAYAGNPAMGEPYERFYAIDSTLQEITTQGFTTFRYSVLRHADGTALWPDSPGLRVYGVNSAGEKIENPPIGVPE